MARRVQRSEATPDERGRSEWKSKRAFPRLPAFVYTRATGRTRRARNAQKRVKQSVRVSLVHSVQIRNCLSLA